MLIKKGWEERPGRRARIKGERLRETLRVIKGERLDLEPTLAATMSALRLLLPILLLVLLDNVSHVITIVIATIVVIISTETNTIISIIILPVLSISFFYVSHLMITTKYKTLNQVSCEESYSTILSSRDRR